MVVIFTGEGSPQAQDSPFLDVTLVVHRQQRLQVHEEKH